MTEELTVTSFRVYSPLPNAFNTLCHLHSFLFIVLRKRREKKKNNYDNNVEKNFKKSGDLTFKRMHFQKCFYSEKVKGMHSHLLGAYILVGFWNVSGISSCESNLFSRKHRSSDLRSPELTDFTSFKFSLKTQ